MDEQYRSWLSELKTRYQGSQIKAAMSVNQEMLVFYWSLGRDIVQMKAESTWGSGFYAQLSKDMRAMLPNAHGLSATNLKYMRRYYVLTERAFRPQLVDEMDADGLPQIRPQPVDDLDNQEDAQNKSWFSIPWGHIRIILDKCGDSYDSASFYAQQSLRHNWSRAVLLNFLDTDLYERQGKAVTNFALTLPSPQSDLAQELTRDPYNFDFLTIRERYDEKELKDALMDNITRFLLELGNGFAFVGREVRIEVGNTEKFIDMLFFNLKMRCYVVLEVKVTEFDAAYAGQLGTYVVAVNHQMREDWMRPTVGLLVCKSMDKIEAQYALESSSQPLGVSGYQLSKLIPEDFRGSLPTIEEIEQELSK